MIDDFHFLRPWWLVAVVVPLAILWLASRSSDVRSQWKGMIAPHLLDRLVVERSGASRVRPSWLLAAMLFTAVVAVAGPSWERETPPFVADTASLVIAADLSQTMDAIDITPTRLERAKLKIRDIIGTRGGGRTAVVVYAGSTHLVLPFTDDSALIETYTDALATGIMPIEGKNTARAIQVADDLLTKESVPGTILLLTDGVENGAFDAFKRTSQNGLVVLGIGTASGGPVKTANGDFLTDASGARVFAKLDLDALKAMHAATGADVATITDDDTDVRWIAQRIRTNFAQKQATTGDRWRDMGWWIVVPSLALFALSFRKGWVVRIGSFVIAARMMLPGEVQAGSFADMWLTPDQQGRIAYQRGNDPAAADRFTDPMWKAVALYRSGKFADAVDALAKVDSAESWYNQGNALMHLAKLDEAAAAYKKALEKHKDWPAAQANLAVAERLIALKKEEKQEEQQQPNENPDSVQFDDKGKQGKKGEIAIAEQTSEMWIKNIQVSPADLMARKFAIEAQGKKP
jgi:Ca-activated chloride channel family protein